MNILIIVTEINSANGICCASVARKLIENGNKVFFVTNAEYKKFSKIEGAEYITVKPRLTYRLFAKAELCQKVKKKFLFLTARILNKIKLILSVFTWPLISPIYCRRLYSVAKHVCETKKIDCIIPVYTQIDTLIAAKKIKQENSMIKYIPYFLDSFSGGYGPKVFSKDWIVKRGRWWEDRLLPCADKIIMMQSCKEHYQKYANDKEYYKRIVFLDLPLFTTHNGIKENNSMFANKINLLYIGTIPTHIRNPQYFLDVFSHIENTNIDLNIVGTCTDFELLRRAAAKDSRIKIFPPVNHDKALSLMQQADLLVNFGNNNPNMTPCKIFEYMSLGKPIISVSPIPNEPSKIYLEKYPTVLLLEEYRHDIYSDVNRLNDFIGKSEAVREVDLQKLNNIFYSNTPEAFVSEIISEE